MKTPFRKLRGLAFRHGHHKDRRDLRVSPSDELDHAAKDMVDMRDCYDGLLSAAAATANSAFEFSESLRELGGCLLEKTALNDDEESGKVLLMLGKVQYELQSFVDSYRSHIFQTITIPSESLLNELRTVEEMKRQCDEKRNVCEYMAMRQRESGRGRSGKAESFSKQQLQMAHDEYDEEATLFVFRLKSLKQGQSRSLLTQAARHYAAQLCFFKKALKSLEDIEPHVKMVTERQHIDYHFSELEYGGGDDSDDSDDDDEEDDDGFSDALDDVGELSFEYKKNGQDQDGPISRKSMELDIANNTFPEVTTLEYTKENLDTSYRKSFSFRGENKKVSQSAPLFAENKHGSVDGIKQAWPTYTRKFDTHALPLPNPADTKSSNSGGSVVLPQTLKSGFNGGQHNIWHSSPLEPRNHEKLVGDRKHLGYTLRNAESVLRESNKDTAKLRLPPQLDVSFPSHHDPNATFESRKVRRQSFSGPVTSRAWLTKPASTEPAGLFSGPILQNPTAQLLSSSPKVSPRVSPKVSAKVSPTTSPTFVSSLKISELHELPRPPAIMTTKSSRPMSLVGYSAPIVCNDNTPPTRKSSVLNKPSPLPTPSQVMSRSFSIPSSSFKAMAMSITKSQESTQNAEVFDDMISPPLTPISLTNLGSPLTASQNVNRTIPIRGAH